MATIGEMFVRGRRRQDDSWLVTVCYTAFFADGELGQRFDDAVQIRMAGRSTPTAAVDEAPVGFTASNRRVFRKKRIVVPQNALTARTGLDDLCASIRLHHSGTDIADDERCTPPLGPPCYLDCSA